VSPVRFDESARPLLARASGRTSPVPQMLATVRKREVTSLPSAASAIRSDESARWHRHLRPLRTTRASSAVGPPSNSCSTSATVRRVAPASSSWAGSEVTRPLSRDRARNRRPGHYADAYVGVGRSRLEFQPRPARSAVTTLSKGAIAGGEVLKLFIRSPARGRRRRRAVPRARPGRA